MSTSTWLTALHEVMHEEYILSAASPRPLIAVSYRSYHDGSDTLGRDQCSACNNTY